MVSRQTGFGHVGPYANYAVPSSSVLVAVSPELTTPFIAAYTSGTGNRVKEIVIAVAGAYRFKWHMAIVAVTVGNPSRCFAQVRRNDAVWGGTHAGQYDQIAPEQFEEDLGGWQVGDKAGLYLWSASGSGSSVQARASNFSLWADYGVQPSPVVPGAISHANWNDFQFTFTGVATAGSSTSVTDSTLALETNAYTGYTLTLISGTGSGQSAIITSNTGTLVTATGAAFAPAPVAGTGYAISYGAYV